MCGATSAQKDLQAQQAAFYSTLTSEYQTEFGQSQQILGEMTKIFEPILNAGPSQKGFSDAEDQDLNTQATESVASGYKNAKQSLQEDMAARGGSDFVPSGEDTQLSEGLAATGTAEQATLKNQIEEQNYATGRANYDNAVTGLINVNSGLSATSQAANAATGAGSAASTTANEIAQADNSVWSSVIGGLSGIAGQAAGGYFTGVGKKSGG